MIWSRPGLFSIPLCTIITSARLTLPFPVLLPVTSKRKRVLAYYECLRNVVAGLVMLAYALSSYKRFREAQAKPFTLNSFTFMWADSKQRLSPVEESKLRCPKCKRLMLKAMQTECGHRMCLQCLGPDAETRSVWLQVGVTDITLKRTVS